MSPEQWENDLRKEAEGLDFLAKLLRGFDNLLEEAVDEYGTELDPNLVMLLEALRYDVNITLSGTVKLDNGTKIPGVYAQLEDVMDEIQTLQAGKPTKGGVADEDLPEDDE